MKIRCKSWDFLLYIAVKMAGKCLVCALLPPKTTSCVPYRVPCTGCPAGRSEGKEKACPVCNWAGFRTAWGEYSFHALCMISERLYFFILSSLYFAGQLLYNGLDPVVGFGSVVSLVADTGPFFIYSFQEVGYCLSWRSALALPVHPSPLAFRSCFPCCVYSIPLETSGSC